VKTRAVIAIVLLQCTLLSSNSWADESPDYRPHISNIGGDDRSPGVTIVIIFTLLLIGFGIGLMVGRRTRNREK